jgi:hypothetical protein
MLPNEVKYKKTYVCMCGHEFDSHYRKKFCLLVIVLGCGGGTCKCTEFKLDNLKFIEQLAKKRNLV